MVSSAAALELSAAMAPEVRAKAERVAKKTEERILNGVGLRWLE